MIIVRRSVADRWPGLAWWAIGVVALVLFTVALFPSIEGNADFDKLAKDLPEAMRSLFAFSDAIPITSAPGYLQTRLFGSLLPLVLLVFSIGAGARAIGGSEEDGTIELVMMHPVTRKRVAVERYVALAFMVGSLTLATLASLLVLGAPFGALKDVSIAGAVAASAAAGLLALLHGSLAFTVGAVTGRRAPAIAIATTTAVVGYLIHGLAPLTDALHPLRLGSPWHWYGGRNMLAEGIAPDALIIPVLLSVALLVPAAIAFTRRDLR